MPPPSLPAQERYIFEGIHYVIVLLLCIQRFCRMVRFRINIAFHVRDVNNVPHVRVKDGELSYSFYLTLELICHRGASKTRWLQTAFIGCFIQDHHRYSIILTGLELTYKLSFYLCI